MAEVGKLLGLGLLSFPGAQVPTWDALNATYAPLTRSRLPRTGFVGLGDSVTNNNRFGEALAAAGGFSGGWDPSGANAGIAGNTSTQMLARFATDVAAKKPAVVHILAGTNDTGQSVPLATLAANIRSMVARTLEFGGIPVLATIPPNSTGTPVDRPARIVAANQWICRYALSQGFRVADYYRALVDPTTGHYASGYDAGDGTHPSAAGNAAMLTEFIAALSREPDQSLLLSKDNADPWNWCVNGQFQVGTTGSVPTSWTQAGSPTGLTLSLAADAANVTGRWFGVSAAASSATAEYFQAQTAAQNGSGPVVGNWMMIGARAATPTLSAAQFVSIRGRMTGGSEDLNWYQMVMPMPAPFTMSAEHAVTTGTTGIQFDLQLSAGTGATTFGQITGYDLTAMGVTDTSGKLV